MIDRCLAPARRNGVEGERLFGLVSDEAQSSKGGSAVLHLIALECIAEVSWVEADPPILVHWTCKTVNR